MQEAQAVASNVYNQLLTGMSNVRTQLEALQVAMQSAASNAQAAGEDQAGIIDAVNSAAQAFASGSGFTLSEVLDNYLNGEQITPRKIRYMLPILVEFRRQ